MPDTKQKFFQTELDLLKGRDRHQHLHQLLPWLKKDDPVLDLGCGLLVNSLYLKGIGFKVVGTDISIEMLRENNKTDISISCADGLKLPFKPNCFGGILLVDIIEHLPREKADPFIKEIRRVLKKDGIVFLHVPLERSLSYRLLNKLRIIWSRNPNHLYDYNLKTIKRLVKKEKCNILWEHKENGMVCSLKYFYKEIRPLIIISKWLGCFFQNTFTAAYTACICFETNSTNG